MQTGKKTESKNFFSFLVVLFILFIATGLTGCGKTDHSDLGGGDNKPCCDNGNPAPPIDTDFEKYCKDRQGTLVNSDHCEWQIHLGNPEFHLFQAPTSIPAFGNVAINPGIQSSITPFLSRSAYNYALPTFIKVGPPAGFDFQPFIAQRFERVVFEGTGRWGYYDSFTFIFGQDDLEDECENQRDLDGRRNGGVQVSDGLPEGLIGTDGPEVFVMGSNVEYEFIHGGGFFVGLNIASHRRDHLHCWEISPSRFYIRHCENSRHEIIRCSENNDHLVPI